MAFHIPSDPFLKDAEGAARFCRDLIGRVRKWTVDFGPAVYWSARWAGHWAQKSTAWASLRSASGSAPDF